MKVAIFAGTNLRHKYFANKIIDNFDVAGLVAQQRDYDRERNVAGDIKLEYSGEDAELMDWPLSGKWGRKTWSSSSATITGNKKEY